MGVDGVNVETGSASHAPSGSHWITDEETQRIAETFVAASPYLGDIAWSQVPVGENAAYLCGFSGEPPEDLEPGDPLPEGCRWSWQLSLTDPSGRDFRLHHGQVVSAITKVVHEGDGRQDSMRAFRLGRIEQWYTEPADSRRALKLGPEAAVTICQIALWDRVAFPYEDENGPFGTGRMDFFEEQR